MNSMSFCGHLFGSSSTGSEEEGITTCLLLLPLLMNAPFPELIPVSSRSKFGSHSGDEHAHSCGHDHGHDHGRGHEDFHGHGSLFIDTKPSSFNLDQMISQYLPMIWVDQSARHVFLFISAKLVVMLLQLLYGVIAGKIDVVSASFHTLFDCFAMSTALIAMVLMKKNPDKDFSYGYDRFSVLAAFTNALFLLFVALFLIIESTHKLFKPPEVHGISITMAYVGLFIDLGGLWAFWPFARKYFALDINSVLNK